MRFAQILLVTLAILLALPFLALLVILADFLYSYDGVWALKVGPNGLHECVFVPGPSRDIFIFALILAGCWTIILVLAKKRNG